jgi:hypothetical protein
VYSLRAARESVLLHKKSEIIFRNEEATYHSFLTITLFQVHPLSRFSRIAF